MTDFDTMMKDANRLKVAIRLMIDQYKNNKSAINRIHAAFILVDRATSANELEYACGNLRAIFKDLNHRELEYERELSDPAQSLRTTSVRHSPQTRDDRAEWRRDVDSVDERAQGVPVLVPPTDASSPTSTDGPSNTNGLARPLQPQQKRHRATRRKSRLRRDDAGTSS